MLLLDLICMFMGREPCLSYGMCMEVRGWLRRVGSLLLCGDQGSNSGHKVWKQEILITEPSRGLSIFYSNNKYQELYDRGTSHLAVMNWPLEFLTAWNSLTRSLYPLFKPSHFISLIAQWHTQYFLTIKWGPENVNDLGNTARNSSTSENLKA